MLGDAADLVEILHWCVRFYDTNREPLAMGEEYHGVYKYSAATRNVIATMTLNLAEAFEKVEREFLKSHRLADAEDVIPFFKQAYDQFVATRRDLALKTWPYPTSDDEDDVETWKGRQLLRLLPGDAGFVIWSSAKQSFMVALHNQLIIETGAEDLSEPAVADILDTFPTDVYGMAL